MTLAKAIANLDAVLAEAPSAWVGGHSDEDSYAVVDWPPKVAEIREAVREVAIAALEQRHWSRGYIIAELDRLLGKENADAHD